MFYPNELSTVPWKPKFNRGHNKLHPLFRPVDFFPNHYISQVLMHQPFLLILTCGLSQLQQPLQSTPGTLLLRYPFCAHWHTVLLGSRRGFATAIISGYCQHQVCRVCLTSPFGMLWSLLKTADSRKCSDCHCNKPWYSNG